MNTLIIVTMATLSAAMAVPSGYGHVYGYSHDNTINGAVYLGGPEKHGAVLRGASAAASKVGGPHVGSSRVAGPYVGSAALHGPVADQVTLVGPSTGAITLVGPTGPSACGAESGAGHSNHGDYGFIKGGYVGY